MEHSPSLPKIQPAGLRSPTVLSLQVSGWLLFSCLWLPLCRGCGGGPDKLPVQSLRTSPLEAEHQIANFVLLGTYGNGMFIATCVAFSAWLVSEKFWKGCLITQFFITSGISIAVVVVALVQSGSGRQLLNTILVMVPALIGFLAWVSLAIRRQAYQDAWARLQHTWTMIGLFFVHGLLLFEGRVLYGYWVTMVALVCIVIAVEVARHRMKHDLWDSEAQVVRPQFTIRKILFWTAFFPIVFGYCQAIEAFCNWAYR
jgi:hypothetical protein